MSIAKLGKQRDESEGEWVTSGSGPAKKISPKGGRREKALRGKGMAAAGGASKAESIDETGGRGRKRRVVGWETTGTW